MTTSLKSGRDNDAQKGVFCKAHFASLGAGVLHNSGADSCCVIFSGFHLPQTGMFKAVLCAHFWCADFCTDFCADFWCAAICTHFCVIFGTQMFAQIFR